jgi:hypothetical protein
MSLRVIFDRKLYREVVLSLIEFSIQISLFSKVKFTRTDIYLIQNYVESRLKATGSTLFAP